jgi:hypothetical protein
LSGLGKVFVTWEVMSRPGGDEAESGEVDEPTRKARLHKISCLSGLGKVFVTESLLATISIAIV